MWLFDVNDLLDFERLLGKFKIRLRRPEFHHAQHSRGQIRFLSCAKCSSASLIVRR